MPLPPSLCNALGFAATATKELKQQAAFATAARRIGEESQVLLSYWARRLAHEDRATPRPAPLQSPDTTAFHRDSVARHTRSGTGPPLQHRLSEKPLHRRISGGLCSAKESPYKAERRGLRPGAASHFRPQRLSRMLGRRGCPNEAFAMCGAECGHGRSPGSFPSTPGNPQGSS